MHVNIVTLEPGAVIPFAETHVMEHGLYVLQGKGVYRLNQDWVEVEAGDYYVASRILSAGLLCRRSGAFQISALQGRQSACRSMEAVSMISPVAGLAEVKVEEFAAETFGGLCEIIEIGAAGSGIVINGGKCVRYKDLATLDFDSESGGRLGISLFQAELTGFPHRLDMMERHPLGSQAFIPMDSATMLLAVSPDNGGKPGRPRATVIGPGQAVNILRNVWHGVLTPLSGSGLFAVVDRIGSTGNLVEHWFERPFNLLK